MMLIKEFNEISIQKSRKKLFKKLNLNEKFLTIHWDPSKGENCVPRVSSDYGLNPRIADELISLADKIRIHEDDYGALSTNVIDARTKRDHWECSKYDCNVEIYVRWLEEEEKESEWSKKKER